MGVSIRVGKSTRSPGYLGIFGGVLAFAALVFLIKLPIDASRESRIAKWPTISATVSQMSVRRFQSGRDTAWRIEGLVRYSIPGETLTSSIRSRAGGIDERRAMREWVSRHGPGTSLPVRYDPQSPDVVAPGGGDMPESGSQVPDDEIALAVLALLSVTLITIDRALQRNRDTQAEAPGG